MPAARSIMRYAAREQTVVLVVVTVAAGQAVTRHPSANATSGTNTPSRSPNTVAAR